MRSISPTLGIRKQRSFFLLFSFIVSAAALSFGGNTYYVSQSGGSVSCGADGTQNTQPYTFVNNAGNYAAGDTIKLCGTITGPHVAGGNVFSIRASGGSGSPITFFWESNASISEPACQGNNGGGCINTNNNTYLIFDGNGTTNSIVGTANGSPGSYPNQVASNGIYATNCSNCEFKNLDIEGMYVMASNTDSGQNSWDASAIVMTGSNYSIHDNMCNNAHNCFNGGLWNSASSNIQIYNNTLDHFNFGITYVGNTSAVLSVVYVHDNHLKNMNNWDNVNDTYHHDGIFFCNNSGVSSTVKNIYIYNNLFDGDPGGDMTAWVYMNQGLNGMYVFNNVFLNPSGRLSAGANTLLEGGLTGDQNYIYVNNFFDCNATSTWRAIGIGGGGVNNLTLQNNAFMRCPSVLQISGVTGSNVQSNNVINTTSLGADSSGHPLAGSVMIHNGTTNYADLSSMCSSVPTLCRDKAGNARPSSGSFNWDAGPYMYQTGGSAPNPPSNLTAIVQ